MPLPRRSRSPLAALALLAVLATIPATAQTVDETETRATTDETLGDGSPILWDDLEPEPAAIDESCAGEPAKDESGVEECAPPPDAGELDELAVTESSYPPYTGDCLEDCVTALFKAIDGVTPFVQPPGGCMGENALPNWNVGPGSQNWPVVCQAAKYIASGNQTWLLAFFDYQRTSHGFMGREILSPLYGPVVVAPIVAALNEAQDRGHTNLAGKATAWLRAYWALNTLVAVPSHMPTARYREQGVEQVQGGNGNYLRGLTVAACGARTNPGSTSASHIHPMLTYALNWDVRRYSPKKVPRSGWQRHLRAFFDGAGVPLNGDSVPAGTTIPAADVGLTNAERQTLRAFIGNPLAHLDAVTAMVAPHFPYGAITFLRTTQGGTMSYFGLGTLRHGRNPNPNKCPFFAVRTQPNGETSYLHPHRFKKAGCSLGDSWRESNSVCALGDGVTDCLTLPPGAVLFEVGWDTTGQWIRLQ